MLVVAGASLVGMLVDPRIITGAPAWLKPFKFAISTAVYSLTLAWIFTFLPDWPRVRRVVGWTTAIVFVLEVAIIDAQAWRGTTSHFNVSTTLDMVLFFVMGTAILLQTLVSVAVAVALWRQRFTDQALGWALRLGMTLTIMGALTGPLMTRPTEAQLARRPRRWAHDDRGRAYGRWRGWRSRRASNRVESRARRSARSALHWPARDPGAGAHRDRPEALAPARSRSRQGNVGCRGKLCVAVSPAAVGGAARTKCRRPRCNGTRVDRDLGHVHRARPWLDRPWFTRASRENLDRMAV